MAPEARTTDNHEEAKASSRSSPSNPENVHHSLEGDSTVKEKRGPHCAQAENGIQPLTTDGGIECEADKQRAPFETSVADQVEDIPEDRGDQSREGVKERVKGHLRRTGAGEEKSVVPVGRPEGKIMKTVAKMIRGNIKHVRQYLESSPDRDVFLYGTEDSWIRRDGDTLVYQIEDKSRRDLLLRKGAEPNVMNLRGRTPLAEAALWGRLKNTKLLLEYGANEQLECTQTDTSQRDQDRTEIVDLLYGISQPDINHYYSVPSFSFMESTPDQTLLTFAAEFQLSSEWKTIGVLYSGGPSGIVTATSGWAKQANHEPNTQIDGRKWTDEAIRLCEDTGYELEPHVYDDRDKPGSYYACHAEKQLAAFFIQEHRLSPCEADSTLGLEKLNLSELSDQESEEP
ncbi:DYW family of nucleic acid deaminases-domain-containing protein [Hypoxylon cercidicola]|nr:DYW family of nucleic acid deaminases-domain-containing protein [Hypoxylon cercidicola]